MSESEPLPEFAYHPDPVGTGSVEPSDVVCASCGRQRGYIYAGPVYAVEELDNCLCPWCIADGSAAQRFDATFTDDHDMAVGSDVRATVTTRTPGFNAWQQEHWMFHCGDGAAFIGVVGAKELQAYPDAVEMLRHEHDEYGWPEEQVEQYLSAMDKDGQPTGYLFECRHCGTRLAYSDFT